MFYALISGLGSGSCLLDGRALPARPCILQGKQTQILEIGEIP